VAAAGYPPLPDLPSAAGETAGDTPRGLTTGFVSIWPTRRGPARTGPIDTGPRATARSGGTERIEPAPKSRQRRLAANHAPSRDPRAPTRAGSAVRAGNLVAKVSTQRRTIPVALYAATHAVRLVNARI
jgi:hypothetical protein